jgi:hypothetical protein
VTAAELTLSTSATGHKVTIDQLHSDPRAEALSRSRSARPVQVLLLDAFELLRSPELLHPGESDCQFDIDLRVDPDAKELFLHIRRPGVAAEERSEICL